MSDQPFEQLDETFRAHGAAATIDRLAEHLRTAKRYHALFDALLMKKRLDLELPLTRPSALKDVPESRRDEFENFYIDTAREVGRLLLAEGSIPHAWHYFRAINEPAPIAQAIEALPEDSAPQDDIIEIALIQGVAPVKGLRLFLASHGTCSTITAFDQQYLQLAPEFRRQCAGVLVRKLYDDLRANVESDVERRHPGSATGLSLRELMTGREELVADGAYHIDVSHLNAVVRFARALEPADPELDLALQMAEYGSQLASQYQYPGNPPFEDFYPAHLRFFQALMGQNREEGIAYFRDKLGPDPADSDAQLAAFVLVDLLQRLNRNDEALEVACRYFARTGPDFGLSLPELCAEAGRFDLLKQLAVDQGDLVHYTAALLSSGTKRPD